MDADVALPAGGSQRVSTRAGGPHVAAGVLDLQRLVVLGADPRRAEPRLNLIGSDVWRQHALRAR
jgi:hypothetical protein